MVFARRALAALLALTLPLAENPAWGASKTAPPAAPAATTLPTLPTIPALPSAAPIPTAPAVQAPALNPDAAIKAAAQNAVAPAAVEAIAKGDKAGPEIQVGLGAELEAELASGSLGVVRREKRGWRLVSGDDAGHAANVLAAMREIERSGIPLLSTEEVVVLPARLVPAARAAASPAKRAVLASEAIANLSAPAVARGGKPTDGIVQSLLIVTLTQALPKPLRQTIAEAAEAGLVTNPYLSGKEAIRIFKDNWLKHADELTAMLPAAFAFQDGLATKMLWPSSVVDPGTGSLFSADRFSRRLETRGRGPDGAFEMLPNQESSLKQLVTGISFDPASRTLWLWGHREYGRAGVDASGRVAPPEWRAYPKGLFAPQVKAFDPRSGRLLILDGLEHELRRVLPDGSLSQPLQRLGWKDFRAASAAFDPESGALLSISDGELQVRARDADGLVSLEPVQSVSLGSGYSIHKLAVDPYRRVLYSAVRLKDGPSAIEARRLTPEGRVGATPFDAFPFEPPQHFDLTPDPLGDSLLIGVNRALLRYRVSPERLPRLLEAMSPAALEAAAAVAARASGPELAPIVQAVRGSIESLAWTPWAQGLWRRMTKSLVLGHGLPGKLRRLSEAERWFPGAEAELRERMPLLWRVLREPARLSGLLLSLSILRMGLPYFMANGSPTPPLAWSLAQGLSFGLGKLLVSPVSESFRRHIISVEDKKGLFAVELKMPGEEEGRESIYPEHFDAAKELWEGSPDDPGVVKPLFYGQYRGKVRLYGKDLTYAADDPLGVMLFRYEDGKRLRNVGAIPDRYAREGLPPADLIRRARADAAAASIRLHRLGWKGFTDGGNDMHAENVRVFPDGRAVLVGDFGAFEREPLDWGKRSLETLMLVGLDPAQHRELIQELEPLVFERLSRGKTDAAELASIRDEVRRELGLERP